MDKLISIAVLVEFSNFVVIKISDIAFVNDPLTINGNSQRKNSADEDQKIMMNTERVHESMLIKK